ncbi:alpha/beta hydrolase [uncultured Paracoccus sp.]|uniref:alpha/beta hydrolase family protein n=1 Tax=uncultured Paracoccus sp. TaxID=189685 RepID=UPI00260CB8AB|nr:alpha/beta hydrolase [uncultured Paracoccus sp.]
MESFITACADGGEIALTLHGGKAGTSPVVVIHPATAVRERMYHPFAGFLVEQGLRVITYNYRGVGAGAGLTQNRHLTMRNWMLDDAPAVQDWAVRTLPGAPLLAIGHSLGGHAIGMGGKDSPLQAAVLIASHAGALRLVRRRAERLRIGFLFRAVVPVAGRLSGCFPGKRLGVGENIPSVAMRDWGHWILMRNYFFDDPTLDAAKRFAKVNFPLLSLGFEDDPWATPAAIDLLNCHFATSPPARRQIDPARDGTGPVGHMGFFRDHHRNGLWTEVTDWLRQQAEAATTGPQRRATGG